MPITQNRMLDLIEAAQDYRQAWTNGVNQFAKEQSNIEAGLETYEQAWFNLGLLLRSVTALQNPIKTTETIAKEIEHFRISYRKNITSANWQRAKRGAETHPIEYGIDPGVQTSRFAKTQIVTRPVQTSYLPVDPRLANLGNTDGVQIQSDTELDFEPGQISPEAQERIKQELDTLGHKEDYEREYGPKQPQSKD